MSCNGRCKRLKFKKNTTLTTQYDSRHKRCPICKIFVMEDESYCPCCNMLLEPSQEEVIGNKNKYYSK